MSGALAAPTGRLRAVSVVGVLTVGVLGGLVVLLARWGPDWPAQEFRAWIADQNALSSITTRWYSGLPLPGYSVLYPSLAALVGVGVVGLASGIALTWGACGLAPAVSRPRAVAFGVAVAVATTESLLIGQVPFLMGAAFAAWAVRVVLAGRPWPLALALAAGASLSSPLAGAFLLLAGPAIAVRCGWRRTAPVAAAGVGPLVAAAVGGAGGPFPCPWEAFVGTAAFCLALLWWAPRGERALRVFALCYLAAAVLAFLVPNPVGGNVTRLGKLLAVPLVCCYLPPARRFVPRLRSAAAAATALAAVAWPTVPFVSSATDGAGDPSRNAAFYDGLLGYLHHHVAPGSRVEIPFTREHWEAFFVAQHVPIARGWERQSDLEYNAVLYRPLSPAAYRTWLDDNAVGLVALPQAPVDYGGRAEAALLRQPPPYLRPVWHDAHWQVWRVVRPTPLVTGAARLVSLDTATLRLRFTGPGDATVRLRGGPLWETRTSGSCVATAAHGWLLVHSARPGVVVLTATLRTAILRGRAGCAS